MKKTKSKKSVDKQLLNSLQRLEKNRIVYLTVSLVLINRPISQVKLSEFFYHGNNQSESSYHLALENMLEVKLPWMQYPA